MAPKSKSGGGAAAARQQKSQAAEDERDETLQAVVCYMYLYFLKPRVF